MNSGLPSEVIPIASQTGPRGGQNDWSGFLNSAIAAFFNAPPSRYSRNESTSSGECQVTEVRRPIAPLRRSAPRSNSGFRLIAICSHLRLPALAKLVIIAPSTFADSRAVAPNPHPGRCLTPLARALRVSYATPKGDLGSLIRVGGVTSPSFCTNSSERVYITAMRCEIEFGGARELQAAGAGGL